MRGAGGYAGKMAGASAGKWTLISVKALVSGALIAYLIRRIDLHALVRHFREMDLRFFLAAVATALFIFFLTAVRWKILLGGSRRTGMLFSLCLIGAFFNNLLPGAVGGDAVKAYYLYQETREGGRSIASVFLDRYLGFLGLLIIGLVSGLIAFPDLASVGMQWVTPLLFAAFLAGSLAVFGLRIGRRYATVAHFYDYLHDTLRQGGTVLRALGLSLAIQALSIVSVYLVARAVGQRPPFMALFVFVPVIVTVMMLPVSISGFGLRENAFVLLFGLCGIPAEASTTISLLWFLSIALASLAGLVEYLRRKHSPSLT